MDEAAFPRWMPAQLAARLARYAGAKGRHDLVLRLLGRGSVASLPVKARAVLAHSLAETARFSDLDALIGAVAVQSSSERLRSIAQALDEAADSGWQTQSAVRLIQYAEPARDKDGGHGMPIPYHAATLGAVEIPGLRDPSARLRAIPIDFTDKSVLDLGSCFGGFLFPLRDRLRWGVGVSKNFPTAKAAFNLETFTFNGHTLRTVEIDGKIWFPNADIARALGLDAASITSNVKDLLGGEEKNVLSSRRIRLSGVTFTDRELDVLWGGSKGRLAATSESGLYKIVLRAQRSNPAARDFQEWVTREVLPRIRRDGAYIMGEEKVAINNPPS